ncbi:MFS transporter, partial [Staphylococcus ureilyticus]
LMGFNIYIPVYLQEKVGISPLQSGLVIFPLSVAWTIFNFYLGKVEESLTRKTLYLSAFTLIIVSSIIILFGLKLPLLIALSVI